jgi:hypothetical protein
MKPIKMQRIKIRTPFSKDVLIFFAFVIVAAFLFFLQSLSKSYEMDLELYVAYTDIPKNYAFSKPLPTTITVRIKDTGFNLLKSKIKDSDDTISIRLNNKLQKTKNTLVITNKELKESIINCYDPDAVIISFTPQTIEAKYERLTSKKLPVLLNKKLSFAQQYTLKNNISIEPSEVEIFGAKSILDTIKAIYTEPIVLQNLSETQTVNAKLHLAQNITSSFNEVKVIVPVEQFTEKTMSIPVIGKNFPKEIQLRTFPASVTVSFFVGLSHFNTITANDISVYLDYNDLLKNKGKGSDVVKVSVTDSLISNIRLSPDVVEYIFETIR